MNRQRGSLATLERLRLASQVVDDSPDLISLVDRQYVYRFVNAAYTRWHGKPEARRDDGQVQVSVVDRGVGIDAEDLPRLFQRFFRTAAGARRAEGMGFGLYVTRTLVEAQGGRIWAESERGMGSVFHFTLPVA